MRIVVTGSSGQLGRHAVQHLRAAGHDVLGFDRVANDGMGPNRIGDLNGTDDLFAACAGAEALVHLAAIPAPNRLPDSVTFNNNVAAVYSVCKVACDLGIGRIVIASSIGAYGFLYAKEMKPPDYLPLDEAHPCEPTDPYGLSKIVGETIAGSFARQTDISICSLRFAGINFDPSFERIKQRLAHPESRLSGFWTYVDVRDAVEACRLALEAARKGHHIFNIAAPSSNMREATDELLRRFLPNVPKSRNELTGNWSGMDSRKAERDLGFRARFLWERSL